MRDYMRKTHKMYVCTKEHKQVEHVRRNEDSDTTVPPKKGCYANYIKEYMQQK